MPVILATEGREGEIKRTVVQDQVPPNKSKKATP
jgi:hypothetical protein